jgi:hypothetical protein
MRKFIFATFVLFANYCVAEMHCQFHDNPNGRDSCGCYIKSKDNTGNSNILIYEDQYGGTKPFKKACEDNFQLVDGGCADLSEISEGQLEDYESNENDLP